MCPNSSASVRVGRCSLLGSTARAIYSKSRSLTIVRWGLLMPFGDLARLRRHDIASERVYSACNPPCGSCCRAPQRPRPIEAIGRGPPGRRRRPELQALSNSLQLTSI
jgi:hypothetical protein